MQVSTGHTMPVLPHLLFIRMMFNSALELDTGETQGTWEGYTYITHQVPFLFGSLIVKYLVIFSRISWKWLLFSPTETSQGCVFKEKLDKLWLLLVGTSYSTLHYSPLSPEDSSGKRYTQQQALHLTSLCPVDSWLDPCGDHVINARVKVTRPPSPFEETT